MKPLRIFLFFLAMFGLMLILAWVFPNEGIRLGKNTDLQFMDPRSLFKKDTLAPDIIASGLVNPGEIFEDPEVGEIDSVLFRRDTLPEFKKDSAEQARLDSIVRAKIDSISAVVRPIELSDSGKELLYTFFDRADSSYKRSSPLRILHYGDSQLEDDRMTSLIRYRLQKVFGGSGCGLVPAVPLYFGHPAFREEVQGDWKRYTGFGTRDTTLDHRQYGVLNSYVEIPPDSGTEDVCLYYEFYRGRRASRFTQLKLYLHAYEDKGKISLSVNDTVHHEITDIRSGLQVVSYKPEVKVKKIMLDFEFPSGGRIYGISFDSDAGIQVDNIAMRGSSGTEFTRQDSSYLHHMLKDLDPGLFILQFGGNTVPYMTSSSYYKRIFKRELLYLRELCPDAAIIVIGPSDMSRKEKGKFVTWETLEPLRDAMREAALESGCAFWDMYEAMGGYNSMDAFVKADPALAQADYIHFTPRGANLLAGMFTSSLMLEYNKYRSEPTQPSTLNPQPSTLTTNR